MNASFDIGVDPARDLVRIRLGGFFSPDDLGAFMPEFRRAYAELRCGPNEHLTLVDVRELAIQSQEAVAQFAALLADPRFHARRLACVAACTLARSQLNRALAARRDARVFAEPAEAEAWVLAAGPVSRAA